MIDEFIITFGTSLSQKSIDENSITRHSSELDELLSVDINIIYY